MLGLPLREASAAQELYGLWFGVWNNTEPMSCTHPPSLLLLELLVTLPLVRGSCLAGGPSAQEGATGGCS